MMHTDALMTWENKILLSHSFLSLLYFRFEAAHTYCTEVICAALPGDKLLSCSKVQQRIQPEMV